LYAGLPEVHAVLWEQGKITDLGTLPEGGYQSQANAVNSSGQVVGSALNTIPDANSMQPGAFWLWGGITPPYQYQVRPFLWDQQEGMQDLGTLPGGTDAQACYINERGQVVGDSYTSSVASAAWASGGYALTTNPFLWERGKEMVSLGNLGGTCAAATDLNNQGQVVGEATVTGDLYFHAFLWDGSIHDLGGSFGRNNASAFAINDHGEAVGGAYYPGETIFHAALWRHVGNITDLGTLGNDRCSYAAAINAAEQVGGSSLEDCDEVFRAFLWEDGSMFDLNALIPPGSALHLQFVQKINDRGEIAGMGVDVSGNTHAFLLIPCDENHSGVAGCDYSPVDAAAATRENPASFIQKPTTTAPLRPALHGPANHLLRPLGRRGLVFNPGQMEAKDESSSIAENRGSPEKPAQEFWQYGRCDVGSNGDLTGYCHTTSGGVCRVTHDPTDCRPGRRAKRPEWVLGSFCLPPPLPYRIDASTTCH
jgi:probable HAF family extracellular repeat protein